MSALPPPRDDFTRLYAAVKSELRLFMAEAEANFEANRDELDWFEAIVQGFDTEFNAWQTTTNPHIENYLRHFDNASSRTLRVAGYAFLHVAYDLPRVLADHMHDPGTDRVQLRNLFLRPAPRFRQVFLQQMHAKFSLRNLGLLKPLEILAYWLIALRSVAWIHAEILADRPGMRPQYETHLARALLKAGEEALSKRWILGVPDLEISRLFQFAPAPVMWSDRATSATLGLLAALVLFAGIWLRGQSLSARIQTLGQNVLLETGKVFGKSSG